MNPNTNTPVDRLLEELNDATGSQFEQTKSAPAATKHSLEFYRREIENVFAQELDLFWFFGILE